MKTKITKFLFFVICIAINNFSDASDISPKKKLITTLVENFVKSLDTEGKVKNFQEIIVEKTSLAGIIDYIIQKNPTLPSIKGNKELEKWVIKKLLQCTHPDRQEKLKENFVEICKKINGLLLQNKEGSDQGKKVLFTFNFVPKKKSKILEPFPIYDLNHFALIRTKLVKYNESLIGIQNVLNIVCQSEEVFETIMRYLMADTKTENAETDALIDFTRKEGLKLDDYFDLLKVSLDLKLIDPKSESDTKAWQTLYRAMIRSNTFTYSGISAKNNDPTFISLEKKLIKTLYYELFSSLTPNSIVRESTKLYIVAKLYNLYAKFIKKDSLISQPTLKDSLISKPVIQPTLYEFLSDNITQENLDKQKNLFEFLKNNAKFKDILENFTIIRFEKKGGFSDYGKTSTHEIYEKSLYETICKKYKLVEDLLELGKKNTSILGQDRKRIFIEGEHFQFFVNYFESDEEKQEKALKDCLDNKGINFLTFFTTYLKLKITESKKETELWWNIFINKVVISPNFNIGYLDALRRKNEFAAELYLKLTIKAILLEQLKNKNSKFDISPDRISVIINSLFINNTSINDFLDSKENDFKKNVAFALEESNTFKAKILKIASDCYIEESNTFKAKMLKIASDRYIEESKNNLSLIEQTELQDEQLKFINYDSINSNRPLAIVTIKEQKKLEYIRTNYKAIKGSSFTFKNINNVFNDIVNYIQIKDQKIAEETLNNLLEKYNFYKRLELAIAYSQLDPQYTNQTLTLSKKWYDVYLQLVGSNEFSKAVVGFRLLNKQMQFVQKPFLKALYQIAIEKVLGNQPNNFVIESILQKNDSFDKLFDFFETKDLLQGCLAQLIKSQKFKEAVNSSSTLTSNEQLTPKKNQEEEKINNLKKTPTPYYNNYNVDSSPSKKDQKEINNQYQEKEKMNNPKSIPTPSYNNFNLDSSPSKKDQEGVNNQYQEEEKINNPKNTPTPSYYNYNVDSSPSKKDQEGVDNQYQEKEKINNPKNTPTPSYSWYTDTKKLIRNNIVPVGLGTAVVSAVGFVAYRYYKSSQNTVNNKHFCSIKD